MKLTERLGHVPLIPIVDCKAAAPAAVVQSATLALLEQGVVLLRSAFDPALIAGWRQQFETHTLGAVRSGRYRYRLWPLGERRHHYILEIHRAFNTPDFYANRFVYGTAAACMDNDFMLATAAVAYAEPGAPEQYVHRDQNVLFASERLNGVLPPVSLTVSIPLVATGEVVGGTEFAVGTHRLGTIPDNPRFTKVPTEPGDCLLWDSRLVHRGCANPGNAFRPIVLLYYQRPWFFNFLNYEKDCEIKITRENLASVPAAYRSLFDWCHALFEPPHFESDADGLCMCGSGLRHDACHGVAGAPE